MQNFNVRCFAEQQLARTACENVSKKLTRAIKRATTSEKRSYAREKLCFSGKTEIPGNIRHRQ